VILVNNLSDLVLAILVILWYLQVSSLLHSHYALL